MSKFGFYDPASIRPVENGILAIDFINAQDADDVETVEMRNEEDVLGVIRGLDDQVSFKMARRGAAIEKVAGAIRMNPENPVYGVMTEAASGRTIPVRMAFDVEPGELPEHGICLAMGAMNDGSLEVYKMAVRPIEPGLVIAPQEEPHP